MKVYIATYYKYNNYGTRLQNFALCQVLKQYHCEPKTIYLKSLKEKRNNILKNILVRLPVKSNKREIWINDLKKEKKFREFNKNLNFLNISYKKLCKTDFSNAIAIAGSDQIWSPAHLEKNPEDLKLFFLQFIQREKRYAYAPSFGVSSLSEKESELYKENLNEFNEITVREEAGQKIIKNTINKNVLLMPDPVFLLSKEEWKNFCSTEQINNNYVVTYFLGEMNNSLEEKIRRYAEKNKCKVYNISGNKFSKNSILASPLEFVNLIANANAVFTDSFHATAFSLIMETPFLVFKRSDVKQFSRIETLLNKYGCQESKIENIEEIQNEANLKPSIDNLNVEIIEMDRKYGKSYIEKLIKDNK